ncbi:MAG TPA: hypothetical protein VMD59_11855, partial [Acidimicrobiales bacterium]|nr:hypothetical protein [Acidimicrobiales bacterium]
MRLWPFGRASRPPSEPGAAERRAAPPAPHGDVAAPVAAQRSIHVPAGAPALPASPVGPAPAAAPQRDQAAPAAPAGSTQHEREVFVAGG